MKVVSTFGTLMLALTVCLSSAGAQTVTPPTAKAYVFGVSASQVAKKIPGIDQVSNGLPNVVEGDKVFLICAGKSSSTAGAGWFKAATFTIINKPAGSNSTIATIDSIRASFVADVAAGSYTIEVEGTDNKDQMDKDTLFVNVGSFVGVGGIVTGRAAMPPQCSVCHAEKAAKWKTTKHSEALMFIDTQPGFAVYCLPCHTTGSPNATSKGNGFGPRAVAAGWNFPTAIKPGNYDSLVTYFPDVAEMSHVQCESCHGPGSGHNGMKTANQVAVSYTGSQCMQCHDAPTHHYQFEEYFESGHSVSYNEGYQLEYMNRGSTTNRNSDCARCHTTNGYVDVYVKGKQYTSAPYKYVAPVACVACHNPHEKINDAQLRKPVDEACMDCHSVRVSTSGSMHSSHQGPMLNGEDGKEFPGYTYGNSAHTNIADKCVQCHMALPPDPTLQSQIGGHTFKVLSDNGTPTDPSDDIVNNTGCIQCHPSGVTVEKIEETQGKIKAKLDELKGYLKLRSNGNPLYPADTTLTPVQKDVHWNWYFVNNDLSFGVHNFQYAMDLLQSSIDEIKKTTLVEETGAPKGFELGQNYPNPFNPSTEIRFSIGTAAQVRLEVYDANGRLVNVLVNGFYEAGSYRATWNGLTSERTSAPSGVYLYRLTAGSFTSVRKMVLSK
jgi:predicted CXXCH cytochrome family protein